MCIIFFVKGGNMEIIAAIATDDGESTIKRHFGDAKKYLIYKVSLNEITLIKTISNDTDFEEETHADPRKAGSVAGLLQKENVNTAVSKAFGPNIKRIKKKFVCIIVNSEKVDESMKKVQENLAMIDEEWKKGPERNFLKIQ